MPRLATNGPSPEVTLLGGVATAHLLLEGPVDDGARIAFNAAAIAGNLDVRWIERDGAEMLLVEFPSVVATAAGVFEALNAATQLLDARGIVPAPPVDDHPDRDGLELFTSLVNDWFDKYRASSPRPAPPG